MAVSFRDRWPPARTVNDGERVRVTFHAGAKAVAEIKHKHGSPAVFLQRRASRPESVRSRCSRKDDHHEIRAIQPPWALHECARRDSAPKYADIVDASEIACNVKWPHKPLEKISKRGYRIEATRRFIFLRTLRGRFAARFIIRRCCRYRIVHDRHCHAPASGRHLAAADH